MEIDWDELIAMSRGVEDKNPESLAKLFIDLLQKEYAARHKKRNNLIKDYSQIIDSEEGALE
mgnify:FL=1